MIFLDQAHLQKFDSKTTPLVGNYFFNELNKSLEGARLSVLSIQYQWKWNIHDRHSKIHQLGETITRLCQRGIEVKVILNQESPGRNLTKINRVSGNKLADLGCQTKLLYTGALVHAKVWIIDGRFTFIGSHNISSRALTANEEVSVKIESTEFARIMKEYFFRLWS